MLVVSSNQVEYQEIGERSLAPQDQWASMSISELFEQKNILFDRWEFLRLKGYTYEKDFLEGLHKLEDIIQNKLSEQIIS